MYSVDRLQVLFCCGSSGSSLSSLLNTVIMFILISHSWIQHFGQLRTKACKSYTYVYCCLNLLKKTTLSNTHTTLDNDIVEAVLWEFTRTLSTVVPNIPPPRYSTQTYTETFTPISFPLILTLPLFEMHTSCTFNNPFLISVSVSGMFHLDGGLLQSNAEVKNTWRQLKMRLRYSVPQP